MASPDSLNGLKTQDLLKELQKVNERLDTQQKVRHEANSALQATMGKFGLESMKAMERVDSLENAVKDVASDVKELRHSMSPFAELAKDLKFRLLGDPVMQTRGLVQEHEALKATIESRLSAIEDKGDKTFKEQRQYFWSAVITFLGTLGGALAYYFQHKL